MSNNSSSIQQELEQINNLLDILMCGAGEDGACVFLVRRCELLVQIMNLKESIPFVPSDPIQRLYVECNQ